MLDNQYFLVSPADVSENELVLREEEADHCVKVLRKKAGDRFFVVDGVGNEFEVTLSSATRSTVTCRIDSKRFRPKELPFPLELGIAVLKRDAMEWLVEKSVELGVSRIHPLITERTVVEAGGRKSERWQKIVLAAMKQSRRSVLTGISNIQRYGDFVAAVRSETCRKLIFHEEAADPAPDSILAKQERTVLLIGPEGGFTAREVDEAAASDFHICSLGSRRLRSETAALAALSMFSTTVPV